MFKVSIYKLTQFTPAQIDTLQSKITTKGEGNKKAAYVTCLVRKKDIKLTPEEIVRQLYIDTLNTTYGYSLEKMQCEYIKRQNQQQLKRMNKQAVRLGMILVPIPTS